MSQFQELANLISIRQFVYNSIDDINIRLSPSDLKLVRAKLPYIDKAIVSKVLELKLTQPSTSAVSPVVQNNSVLVQPTLINEEVPLQEAKPLKTKNAPFKKSIDSQ